MTFPSEHRDPGALNARLHDEVTVTPALMQEIIGNACQRFPSSGPIARIARIECLIRAGGWADAALALIELELPQWQLRRIAYDGGEWHCALSRQRELPEWLDQSIETRHRDLALSILSAFVEAQRVSAPSSRPSVPVVKENLDSLYQPVCCDNFS
jgi:hypothetical protein